MKCEIIVIGDELLIGQVTDTNSGYIARRLNPVGVEIMRTTAIRDREAQRSRLAEAARAGGYPHQRYPSRPGHP